MCVSVFFKYILRIHLVFVKYFVVDDVFVVDNVFVV